MTIYEQIRAALAGHRAGLRAADIRAQANLTDAPATMVAIRTMKQRGEILAHAGDSARTTRYSLDPAYVAGASTAADSTKKNGDKPAKKKTSGKRTKPPKRRATHRRKKHAKRAAAAPVVSPTVLPAIASGRRLVMFRTGEAPQIFTREQTLEIASVVFENFDA